LHQGHRTVVGAKGAGRGRANARGGNLGRSACCTGGLFWIAAGGDRGGQGKRKFFSASNNSVKIYLLIKK